MDDFCNKLINIAIDTIPKSNALYEKRNTIWSNNTCKEATRNRRKALKELKTTPLLKILKTKVIRAGTRRTIKTTRRQSWQHYVSKINSRTSIKKVWSIVHKIVGNKSGSATVIHHLQVDGDEITELADISNKTAQTFSNNSSAENYNIKFQAFLSKVNNSNSNLAT